MIYKFRNSKTQACCPWFLTCLRETTAQIHHTLCLFLHLKVIQYTYMNKRSFRVHVLWAMSGLLFYSMITIFSKWLKFHFSLFWEYKLHDTLWYRLKWSFMRRLSEEAILNKNVTLLESQQKLFIKCIHLWHYPLFQTIQQESNRRWLGMVLCPTQTPVVLPVVLSVVTNEELDQTTTASGTNNSSSTLKYHLPKSAQLVKSFLWKTLVGLHS